jgi:hypothetical protein
VGRQSAGNILAMGRCSCGFVVCVVWKVACSRSVGLLRKKSLQSRRRGRVSRMEIVALTTGVCIE